MCPAPNSAEERASTTAWPAAISSLTLAGLRGLAMGVVVGQRPFPLIGGHNVQNVGRFERLLLLHVCRKPLFALKFQGVVDSVVRTQP